MTDVMIVVVLLVIVGGALAYIIKEKKRGVKCIGCPSGATCGHACDGKCSGCGQGSPDSCKSHADTIL